MFMQACNMADLDNDGVLDASRHDDALSRMWKGSETGLPVNDESLMPLTSYDYSDYPNTDQRNYGTVFSDFDSDGDVDLYIAKCRQFVSDPQDPRRINQLWVNDARGDGPRRRPTAASCSSSRVGRPTSVTSTTTVIWTSP